MAARRERAAVVAEDRRQRDDRRRVGVDRVSREHRVRSRAEDGADRPDVLGRGQRRAVLERDEETVLVERVAVHQVDTVGTPVRECLTRLPGERGASDGERAARPCAQQSLRVDRRRQAGDVLGAADRGRWNLSRRCLRGRPCREVGRARVALGDRTAEQPSRLRRRDVRAHGRAAGGLAEDRHVARVAAERAGVLLHPPERGLLIEQGRVARPEVGVVEEAERAQAVVDRHDHDVAVDRELGRVVAGAVAGQERPAVDPHHHGQPRAPRRATGRRGDVEVQAVLVEGRGIARAVRRWAHCEPGAVASSMPRHGVAGRGRSEPQVTHRWCGVRDALEGPVARVRRAPERAVVRADDKVVAMTLRCRRSRADEGRHHEGDRERAGGEEREEKIATSVESMHGGTPGGWDVQPSPRPRCDASQRPRSRASVRGQRETASQCVPALSLRRRRTPHGRGRSPPGAPPSTARATGSCRAACARAARGSTRRAAAPPRTPSGRPGRRARGCAA